MCATCKSLCRRSTVGGCVIATASALAHLPSRIRPAHVRARNCVCHRECTGACVGLYERSRKNRHRCDSGHDRCFVGDMIRRSTPIRPDHRRHAVRTLSAVLTHASAPAPRKRKSRFALVPATLLNRQCICRKSDVRASPIRQDRACAVFPHRRRVRHPACAGTTHPPPE
jgi:hypothetical protein